MKKVALLLILFELVAFPLLLIWVLKTNNPTATTLLILVCILGTLGIVIAVMCGMWNPALKPYPPIEPADDAISKNYQSISLGLVNMGLSVHISVDDSYLHLTPVKPMRACGAASASIPWDALKPMAGRRSTVVKLGGIHTITGPRWCMELVAARQDQQS